MKSAVTPATIAAHVSGLCSHTDGEIVVSPMVWHPGEKPGTKRWSFSVNIGGRAGGSRQRWVSISIVDNDYEPPPVLAPELLALFDTVIRISRPDPRAAIINTLRQRGATVHDMADELEAIRLCERLWPGPRVTKIRRAVEQERALWAAQKQAGHATS